MKSIIFKCVGCRRLCAKQCTQKMSDLPVDRVSQTAPFENVGCDFFGSIQIKIRRSFVKRYGCVFTCLYSRAIHIEVCTDLSSDSFILLFVVLSPFAVQFRAFGVIREQIS